jgi:hypothetical protein
MKRFRVINPTASSASAPPITCPRRRRLGEGGCSARGRVAYKFQQKETKVTKLAWTKSLLPLLPSVQNLPATQPITRDRSPLSVSGFQRFSFFLEALPRHQPHRQERQRAADPSPPVLVAAATVAGARLG